MARPKGGYKNAKGEKLPGVSTVAKLIEEPGGLIHWAWQLGMDGIDYQEARDQAADAGTAAHAAIEQWKRGGP
jgi:hypothetical protein